MNKRRGFAPIIILVIIATIVIVGVAGYLTWKHSSRLQNLWPTIVPFGTPFTISVGRNIYVGDSAERNIEIALDSIESPQGVADITVSYCPLAGCLQVIRPTPLVLTLNHPQTLYNYSYDLTALTNTAATIVIDQTPISPTTNAGSPSVADTLNWKTYANQQRGFSVQYPNDWTVKEQGGSVLFINAQNQQFTIEVLESTTEDQAMSLSGFVKTSSSLFYGSETGNSSATQSFVNGNQVFSASTLVRIYGINGGYQGTGEGFTALIEKDNHFATIDAAAVSENIFDKVLSTFQFIQPDTAITQSEGCTLLPYTGKVPLNQVPYYTSGSPDFRGGMVCKFVVNPNLPIFTFRFAGQADNTFGNIDITEGSSSKTIQTLENTTDPNGVAPATWQSILRPVDANFDGYKDLPILGECGGTGNCSYVFYLYDPSTNQFVQNSFLSDLGTPTFDAAKKQVTASWNSSAGDYEADTYQYQKWPVHLNPKSNRFVE